MTTPGRGALGLWSGVGIVAASMIGAGVFLSAGFMAQVMTAGWILFAWGIGCALSMTGAYTYAEVARRIPRSGGEYTYLSQLLHPAVGALAGWGALLVGFAAPAAINAASAGAFLAKVFPGVDSRFAAVALLVGLTALHAFDLGLSKLGQNVLIAIKALLLAGFVALGLWAGRWEWPSWTPPAWTGSARVADLANSLFFVAFAFSGWNTAVYVAEQFRDPQRDVPRAMVIGCALVGAFYLVVNWVFVANIDPERARVVFRYEDDHITLAHVIAQDLVGPGAARLVSALAVIAFVSAISAMMMVGPRVAAAMARDGLLPRVFEERGGRPPTGSVLALGAVALMLLASHSIREVLTNVGAILVLFTALTACGLFRLRPRPSRRVLVAAAGYAAASAWMLTYGFRDNPSLAVWSAGVAAVTVLGQALLRRRPSRD
jgi:APA family basic amino acid/polyamine antiporter